jgi:hypothetical protein
LASISTERWAAPAGVEPASLPATAANHFKLYFLGGVLHVLERLATNLGSIEAVVDQFPFVTDYLDELQRIGHIEISSTASGAGWLALVARRERAVEGHLPLRALRETLRLDDRTLTLLMAIGLTEEDPRFAFVIESAQPGAAHRPTLGLLTAWWRDDDGVAGVRGAIRALLEHGLVHVMNSDAPRLQWMFQSPPAVWDALRGEQSVAAIAGVTFTAAPQLPSIDGLVLPPETRRDVEALPSVLRSGHAKALIVRGPRHNGRRTIARAIAGSLGRGALELTAPLHQPDDRWTSAGVLATLLHAMPVVALNLGLGETCELPPLKGYDGPIAIVAGRHGAVTGEAVAGAVTLHVPMPGPDERGDLWRRSLEAPTAGSARELGDRFRLTSGGIFRSSSLAHAHAALQGRSRIAPADVRVAGRALHADIERLAAYVPATGGWESLGAAPDILAELRSLELRCRHRERLSARAGASFGPQLTCGVRALFAGPSGTGKTMAARLLASSLQMDLYRLDLASVVNKYLGETEKSLDQLFSRAEELDVVLLIDEGDALLTGRTAVQNSNDRYANLETNYLLQRLESFEGLLVVTTNAVARIDSAFQRRMDVVVEFRMPSPHERWLIWQLHLPLDHGVDPAWLQEAALRCELSGGQIRNAVLHASLSALDHGRPVATPDLVDAVHREYLKAGTVCPLPRSTMALV